MEKVGETVTIRPAVRKDMAKVLQLSGELSAIYNYTPSLAPEEAWTILAGDPRQHLLAAEIGGRIAGVLTVIIVPNAATGRPWGALENFIVDKAWRGQGVGLSLMAEATKICRASGCYKLVLSSNLLREEAHEFYRRLGWQQTHIGFSLNFE